MGTFAGHALPGSFFILFGLWRICDTLKRFYQRQGFESRESIDRVGAFSNRISSPIKSKCCNERRIPLDSFLKAFACLIGLTGEVFTGFDDNWRFVHIGNAQHSTMFITFGLSGIVEAFMFYGLIRTSLQVEHIFSMVALLAEGFLFAFHLHGRTVMDIYIHTLFLGIISLSLVAGFFEVNRMGNPIYALLSSYGLLMQGTWFWQVGAILYPAASWMPTWDGDVRSSIPRAANLFCYHLLVDFTAIIIIAIAMSWRYCGVLRPSNSVSNLEDRVPFTQSPTHCIDDRREMLDGMDEDDDDVLRNHPDEMTLYAVNSGEPRKVVVG